MAQSNMTELDAVNQMLLSIGEQKVNTLESSGVLEVDVAKETLRNTSREVQGEGWHFNTEHRVVLMPDQDGFIALPGNVMNVWQHERMLPVVMQRGNQLYNMTKHTFRFESPEVVSILYCHDFNELIPTARVYITHRASRIFQENTSGSTVAEEFILRREAQARIQLEAADARDAGYNVLWDNRNGRNACLRDRVPYVW